MFRIGKYIETESRLIVARAGERGNGSDANEYVVSFRVMKMFWN